MPKKLTYEEVKEYIEILSNSGCKLISTEYIGITKPLILKCKCGEIFNKSFNDFKNGGSQCRSCGLKKCNEKTTLSLGYVKNFIETESSCKLLSKEYKNTSSKLQLLCSCGNKFDVSFDSFKRGQIQCKSCGYKNVSKAKRLSFNDIKQFIEIDSNSGCTLLSEKYEGIDEPLKILCKCGKEFEKSFYKFKNGSQQCRKCGYDKSNKKLHIEYIKNFIEVESKSGCLLLSDIYEGSHKNLKVKCKCGKPYDVCFSAFKNGQQQCHTCGHRNTGDKLSFTFEEVKKFIEVDSNSNCVLLSNDYINTQNDLNIRCACGNEFIVSFDVFKRGQRQCKKCGQKITKKKLLLSYKDVKKYIEIDSNSGCKLISDSYNGYYEPLQIKCKCGEIFTKSYGRFKNGVKCCEKCSYKPKKVKIKKTNRKNHSFNDVKNYIENNSKCTLLSTTYKKNSIPLEIMCECGEIFWTSFNDFKQGRTKCKNCNKSMSKGEQLIKEFLDKNNIIYNMQYKFSDCKNYKPLPFDFAILNKDTTIKLLIEYDGIQHFEPRYFGSKNQEKVMKNSDNIKKNDYIKNNYCKHNNIYLLRISYKQQRNINNILSKYILNNCENEYERGNV